MLYRNQYRIKSTRLSGWDYTSPGLYFITFCTKGKKHWLGSIQDGEVNLFQAGEIVAEEIRKTPDLRSNCGLDEWIVMPNHVHMIIGLFPVETPGPGVSTPTTPTTAGVETTRRVISTTLQPGSIGAIIGQIKSVATKRVLRGGQPDFGWQPRFFDHIIRDARSLDKVRQYIFYNPIKWESEPETPGNLAAGVWT